MKPCDGQHPPNSPGPYVKGECRVCWLYEHDPQYRALWGERAAPPAGPGPAPPPARPLPCVYLGAVVDRLGCPCPARWVRRCEVHGTCTVRQCQACPDYEPYQ
jgi:hypothetical protein